MDLSKAFEMVNHFKLGTILIERGLPPDLVLIIIQCLRNTTERIVWNGFKGAYCAVNKGVRQGGNLSPFLFKLYLDDVISDAYGLETGCCIGPYRTNIIVYADDVALLADSKENLEKLFIHITYKDYTNWRSLAPTHVANNYGIQPLYSYP